MAAASSACDWRWRSRLPLSDPLSLDTSALSSSRSYTIRSRNTSLDPLTTSPCHRRRSLNPLRPKSTPPSPPNIQRTASDHGCRDDECAAAPERVSQEPRWFRQHHHPDREEAFEARVSIQCHLCRYAIHITMLHICAVEQTWH